MLSEHELARMGASVRLDQINLERSQILNAYPELGSAPPKNEFIPIETANNSAPHMRKRRTMSPAERKAVSRRMRRFWQASRAEKK